MIDWQSVAKNYDGIIITPYLWERRLDPRTHWYYGWDCASGCIWNADVIKIAPVTQSVQDKKSKNTTNHAGKDSYYHHVSKKNKNHDSHTV